MPAIASSYFIRQSPGGERYDGAKVSLSPSANRTGTIEIKLTAYPSGELIDDKPQFLKDSARKAMIHFAKNKTINLSEWNITISDFAYHPVDTTSKGTQEAIYNALVVVFAQFHHLTLEIPSKK